MSLPLGVSPPPAMFRFIKGHQQLTGGNTIPINHHTSPNAVGAANTDPMGFGYKSYTWKWWWRPLGFRIVQAYIRSRGGSHLGKV